jgi:hypothetical protein
VGRHFFLLKVSDWSKSYKPESKILMDIPSALNFFLRDPKYTLETVRQRLQAFVDLWNSTYSELSDKPDKKTLFHLRAPFTDHTPISSHQFVEKKSDKSEQTHTSELVLLLDNYHFVRDDFKFPKMPPCTVDDCSVSFKLSSTTFKPSAPNPEAVAAADSACLTRPAAEVASQYYFDKNGASIPFPAFRQLLRDKEFVSYMENVKQQYEKDLGVTLWKSDDNDAECDGNEKGSDETDGRRKRPKKKINFLDDDFPSAQQFNFSDTDDSDDDDDDKTKEKEAAPAEVEEEAEKGQTKKGKKDPKKKTSKKE